MLSSSEKNKGGRGHGKQPLRHSCNKGKGKKGRSAPESKNNAADSSQQLNNEEGSQWPNNEDGSQWPNNEDEAAEGSQQPNSGDEADEDEAVRMKVIKKR